MCAICNVNSYTWRNSEKVGSIFIEFYVKNICERIVECRTLSVEKGNTYFDVFTSWQ